VVKCRSLATNHAFRRCLPNRIAQEHLNLVSDSGPRSVPSICCEDDTPVFVTRHPMGSEVTTRHDFISSRLNPKSEDATTLDRDRALRQVVITSCGNLKVLPLDRGLDQSLTLWMIQRVDEILCRLAEACSRARFGIRFTTLPFGRLLCLLFGCLGKCLVAPCKE
jgi:hypothetical protein